MTQRILEPEVMDSEAEAIAYDRMDFQDVNQAFVELVAEVYPYLQTNALDLGTGTARIPVMLLAKFPQWQITGIDLAQSMLTIGQDHVAIAGLQDQISLELADAKTLPYSDCQFDLIFSNSLIHHLPDPLPCFQEMRRLLKPTGVIVVRDLLRPHSPQAIDTMVDQVSGTDYDAHQKKLFRDSLYAALTLEEVQQVASSAELETAEIYQSSDRHWTMVYRGLSFIAPVFGQGKTI